MERKQDDYSINLEKVFSFILQKSERDVNTSIEETYVQPDNVQRKGGKQGQVDMVSKVVSEVKNGDNTNHEVFRYNFINYMLEKLDEYIEVGERTPSNQMCFNTLIKYGFLE